ncbi:HTH-type transcriptional regulator glxA [Erwinia tracheiphila PSU-1]|nr:HTH-type transcriptional regulator glxA [Erwinia tracheiphila PSU-1]
MGVWFRRSGEDPQLSPWLRYRDHLHPAIHRAQDLLTEPLEQSWPLEELAARTHVSGVIWHACSGCIWASAPENTINNSGWRLPSRGKAWRKQHYQRDSPLPASFAAR